jgi:hypothetical protein
MKDRETQCRIDEEDKITAVIKAVYELKNLW